MKLIFAVLYVSLDDEPYTLLSSFLHSFVSNKFYMN